MLQGIFKIAAEKLKRKNRLMPNGEHQPIFMGSSLVVSC